MLATIKTRSHKLSVSNLFSLINYGAESQILQKICKKIEADLTRVVQRNGMFGGAATKSAMVRVASQRVPRNDPGHSGVSGP
jgi:hypothetical protein